MRILVFLVVVSFVVSFPLPGDVIVKPKAYGNPEEWGPYFEGDIVGDLPSRGKNGIIDEEYRWPSGLVPYEIRGNFSDDELGILESVFNDYYNISEGCIQFVPRDDEENFVYFNQDDDEGCHSHVGMAAGGQEINYPTWCMDDDHYGSVQHEMYHTLGFYHEQSRSDRDDYVDIQWVNIEMGDQHNFYKKNESEVSAYGEPYDYLSDMHYSQYGFSRNGEPTIITKDPAYQSKIGQRVFLSDHDISKLLKMYECPNAPPN